MREKTSKLLSCVLCFVLVFSLLPVSAMAADSSTVPEPVETTYPADADGISASGNDAKPVESVDKPAIAPELEESVPTPVKDDVTGESESENVPAENTHDAEQLQTRINALPNAERYAELNTDEKTAAANEYALIIAELEAQGFDPDADDFESKCIDAGLNIANLVAFAGILAGETNTLEGNNFDVSTSDEYAAAVDAINAADSGSFTITLKNDVSLNGDYTFTKNTTTIYGEGHTLSGGNNGLIHVGGSAAVNLGAADYSGSLTLSCGSAGPTVFLGSAGSSVSMYNVSISNSGIFYGVQLQYGTFNMYGGSIKNCSSVTYGGGVLAIGGTFNMYAGEISDNEVSSYGGGIFAQDCTVNLIGGTITGNNAAQIGGGVVLNGSCTVTISNTVICNNTAGLAAADLYIDSGITMTLPDAAAMNQIYLADGAGKKIDGWYEDGDTRYTPSESGVPVSGTSSDELCLVASYKIKTQATVTIEFEGGSDASGNRSTTKTVPPIGSTLADMPTPTKTGCTFLGWYQKNEDGSYADEAYDLTLPIEDDITLYAKWSEAPVVGSYKVEHYQQQTDGTYKLAETESLAANVGSTVTAVPKTYAHYTENTAYTGRVASGTVTADTASPLTLKLYYDLEIVKLAYNLNGGTAVSGVSYETEELRYGTSLTTKSAPRLSGRRFLGWDDGSGNVYAVSVK